jgi:hypothetical protein
MNTDIQDWTEEEAYDEFVKNLNVPEWITLREPKFPICVWVDDSRKYGNDKNSDYLLKKHFLTIKVDDNEFFEIVYYVSIEPEGGDNEPNEIIDGDVDYRWPVLSKKHAYDLIPNFIQSMNFQKTT